MLADLNQLPGISALNADFTDKARARKSNRNEVNSWIAGFHSTMKAFFKGIAYIFCLSLSLFLIISIRMSS